MAVAVVERLTVAADVSLVTHAGVVCVVIAGNTSASIETPLGRANILVLTIVTKVVIGAFTFVTIDKIQACSLILTRIALTLVYILSTILACPSRLTLALVVDERGRQALFCVGGGAGIRVTGVVTRFTQPPCKPRRTCACELFVTIDACGTVLTHLTLTIIRTLKTVLSLPAFHAQAGVIVPFIFTVGVCRAGADVADVVTMATNLYTVVPGHHSGLRGVAWQVVQVLVVEGHIT